MASQVRYLATRLFFVTLITFNSLTAMTSTEQEDIKRSLQSHDVRNKSREELFANLLIDTIFKSSSLHQKTRTPFIATMVERLKKNSQELTKLLDNHSYELNKAVFAWVTTVLIALPGTMKLVSPHRKREQSTIIAWFSGAGIFALGYLYGFFNKNNLLDTTKFATYQQQAESFQEFALILENIRKSERWPQLIQKLSSLKDERKLR